MTQLLFLDIYEFADHSLRGGALITNASGEPVEFRCTDPVKANLLQRTLWGDRLRGHLVVEIIGRPLLEALVESADLILVRVPELIEVRNFARKPVGALLPATQGDVHRLIRFEPNGAADQWGENLRLGVHVDHPTDVAAVAEAIRTLASACRPSEPFERVSTALTLIDDQHKKT